MHFLKKLFFIASVSQSLLQVTFAQNMGDAVNTIGTESMNQADLNTQQFGNGYGKFRCSNGSKICNPNQTGFYECINGRYRFSQCGAGTKCVALNGLNAGCAAMN